MIFYSNTTNIEHMFVLERNSTAGNGGGNGSDQQSVSDALQVIETAFSRIAQSGVDGLDDDSMKATALRLERIRCSLDSVSAQASAELEVRRVTDLDDGLRTATWLSRQAKLPTGSTKARVFMARRLATALTNYGAALAEGRINWDHVKVITDAANDRIVHLIDEVAPFVIASIEGRTFRRWKTDVQELARLLDMDGGHDPANDIEANKLKLSPTGNSLFLKGELSGANALIAKEALESIADELFHQYKRDNEVSPALEIPSRATLLALALVEAARRGLAGRHGHAPRPEATLHLSGEEPGHSDVDDGCGNLDQPFNGFDPHDCDDCSSEDRSGVQSYADLEDLLRRLGSQRRDRWNGFLVSDGEGTYLPRSAWDVLLCDPDLYTIIMDSLGVPLKMGRRVRFATAAQRRAMAARDGGCVFPGCDNPAEWTDAHHARHWEKDGRTDVDGMLSLCRRHHGVAHRRDWDLEMTPDGKSIWTTPSGRRLAGQQHQRILDLDDLLRRDHQQDRPDNAPPDPAPTDPVSSDDLSSRSASGTRGDPVDRAGSNTPGGP